MTIDDLLAAGYRKYPYISEKKDLFQKIVWEGNQKLYYINIYWYLPKGGYTGGFQAEANFYRKHGDHAMTIVLVPTSIEAVEATYAEIYKTLGCVPDILNN